MDKNLITINATNLFKTHDAIKSGQMFRFRENADSLEIFAGCEHAVATTEQNGDIKISSTNSKFFEKFFDLLTDYGMIRSSLSGFPQLKRALSYSSGVRILNQDLLETMIGFIISSNNNISRIRNSIEYICTRLGVPTAYGHAFPTLDALCGVDEQFFTEAGLGYRAGYMVESVALIKERALLERLPTLSTLEAKRELMKLKGVGEKVSDCILVFGLGKRDVFPTDTWIEKAYYEFFDSKNRTRKQIANYFVDIFGDNSAYAQQYLYYFVRETKLKGTKKG